MNFGERRRLPDRRPTSTFGIAHRGKNGQERGYTISVGFFDREEREPAEVFVTGPKVGSELETVARDCAILWSVARQYGAPVDVLAHALTQEQDGSPSTGADRELAAEVHARLQRRAAVKHRQRFGMSPQEIQQTVDELEKLGILMRTGEMRPDGTGKVQPVYALAPEYQCEEFNKALAERRAF